MGTIGSSHSPVSAVSSVLDLAREKLSISTLTELSEERRENSAETPASCGNDRKRGRDAVKLSRSEDDLEAQPEIPRLRPLQARIHVFPKDTGKNSF